MAVERTPRPEFQGWIVGWLVALLVAFGIAYLMFSSVQAVVERHSVAAETAALPLFSGSR
jgi:hypothetical protein